MSRMLLTITFNWPPEASVNKDLSRGRYSLDWGIRLVCQNKYTFPWIYRYNLPEPENVTEQKMKSEIIYKVYNVKLENLKKMKKIEQSQQML